MSRNGVAVFGTVIVVTAAIVAFVLWDEAKDSKRRTAEAAVVGFAATPQEWDEGGDDGIQKGHVLTFSWVDGADGVHTETMERITWYDEEKRYHVCYNPQDATDYKLYPADHACGS